MNVRCDECKFFNKHKLGPDGECRKSPPVYARFNADWDQIAWPLVKADDWCGEWMRTGG